MQAVVCGKKVPICWWRSLVLTGCFMLGPPSLFAQAPDRALLHSDGGTYLNGNPAPETSAIFSDALIQTQKEHSATIDADGSTALLQPETIVQFEGDELVLDHGDVQVNTGRQMRVRVNCMTVVPVTAERTQYEVTDIDGKIKISAYKNDVKVHYRAEGMRKSRPAESSDSIVHEGEQTMRQEKCGAAINPADVVDAKGAILNSVWAKGTGLAAIGVVACLGLCHHDDPVSPSKP